jgi:hypothetical protein
VLFHSRFAAGRCRPWSIYEVSHAPRRGGGSGAAYRTRTCDPRITKASDEPGITELLHVLMWRYPVPRQRHPAASQFGMRPPIGHCLAKALWLGKSQKVDLRYTCERHWLRVRWTRCCCSVEAVRATVSVEVLGNRARSRTSSREGPSRPLHETGKALELDHEEHAVRSAPRSG